MTVVDGVVRSSTRVSPRPRSHATGSSEGRSAYSSYPTTECWGFRQRSPRPAGRMPPQRRTAAPARCAMRVLIHVDLNRRSQARRRGGVLSRAPATRGVRRGGHKRSAALQQRKKSARRSARADRKPLLADRNARAPINSIWMLNGVSILKEGEDVTGPDNPVSPLRFHSSFDPHSSFESNATSQRSLYRLFHRVLSFHSQPFS